MAPEGWHSITPGLVANDVPKLVRFLRDAFGAIGDLREDAPSVMRIGDSNVMVSGVGPREPTRAFLYLYVDDADVTYRRALSAGAASLEEPIPWLGAWRPGPQPDDPVRPSRLPTPCRAQRATRHAHRDPARPVDLRPWADRRCGREEGEAHG